MLLIAQPKSASTSLMWSLSEVLKIKHKNGQNKRLEDKNPDDFRELLKYHGTMVIRNKEFLSKYILDKTIVYKEHILPVEQHVKIINEINKPVIVLIRNEKESVESYKRVFAVLPEVKANFKRLEYDLKRFADIYKRIAEENKLYKIVTYNDVVNNFTETLKSIILHYNLEIPENVDKYELAKRNYTYSRD